MEYRLNYGNGQVSETMEPYSAAVDAYRAQVRFDRDLHQSSGDLQIEVYDGGGVWFALGGTAGKPNVP